MFFFSFCFESELVSFILLVTCSLFLFVSWLCRVEVAAAGLEGCWEELGRELHPGSSVFRVGSGDRAVPQEAGACLRPSRHHCGHPGLGLVLSKADPEADPTGDATRGRPAATRTPHPAAGPARGLVAHGQEEENAPGSHRDPVWRQRLPPHHGAVQLRGLAGPHPHRGAHPERGAGAAETAGVLWELLPRSGQ